MGCDIHGYVEVRHGNRWALWAEDISLPRDYRMFGLLADVRGDGPAVVPVRGFPPDAGWALLDQYSLTVTDSKCEWGSCRIASKADAECWGNDWLDEKHTRIHHPDWHTPSWLTPDEYAQVLERAKSVEYPHGVGSEYDGVLAAMRAFDEARFVFWFDN